MFWKSRRQKKRGTGFARAAVFLRRAVRVLLVLLVVDLVYLSLTWPDWKKIAAGPVPKSSFIANYERRRVEDRALPRLRWRPVPLSVIPKTLIRAVIVAEDSRFYEHSGFDLVAFKEAMEYNLAKGRLVFGASTISQQTAKNLFLTPSRNPVRKWHELFLTWGMERHLTKNRILEIYLNDAEFGPGIYGVQAAAQAYWGVDASQLTPAQAAELAATLPAPTKNNPATRTWPFEHRSQKILSLLLRYPGDAADALAAMHRELGPDTGDDTTADAPADSGTTGQAPSQAPSQAPPKAPPTGLPPVEDRSFGRNAL